MSKVDSYTPINDGPAATIVDTKSESKSADPNGYTPVDQIPVIVNDLRAYFRTHASKTYEWRRSQLLAIKRLLTENEKQLCDALKKDFNKPYFEASLGDVGLAIHDVTETLANLKSYMAPESASTPIALLPGSSFVHHDPYGVVLIIAPFNYPIQLIFQPLIAAVGAGNVAVIKPSELTPATTAAVAELIPKYLDRSAFAVVQGAIPETKALLDQRWAYIFFTGSEMVGKVVAAAAAKYLTPVTLELGGKSPVIVCEDADLVIAARRVTWGKFFNCGQSCVAPDYVFVDSKIKSAFVKQVTKTIGDFYGKDPAASADYTRIVNDRHANRLAEIVEFHKSRSEIIYGGHVNLSERYISPTIVDVKTKDESTKGSAMADELFGPILPLVEFKTAEIDQVIEFLNDRPKPLALYLFTSKNAIQQKVIERTSSGSVAINDCIVQITNSALPFGGVGSSGVGNYHGKYGFNTFSHAKAVMKKYNFGDAPMRYPPYTNFNYAAFRWATSIYRVNSGTIGKFFKYVALPIAVLAALRGIGVSLTYKSNL